MGSPGEYLYITLTSIMLMRISCMDARCPVFVDIFELKRNYEALKEVLLENDINTDISLLKESVLNQIHVPEQCCFLLKLGNFYLANVFPTLIFNQRKIQRHFNNLANGLLGMKIDLKHCHSTMRCPCGKPSLQKVEDFKTWFYKLETSAAAHKAVNDLNILFRWIEKNVLVRDSIAP